MNQSTRAAWILMLVLAPWTAHAQEAAFDTWPRERGHDLAALQRGARTFVNYCLTCHGASLNRWNRLRDIGLDEKLVKSELIFGNQRVTDTMTVSLASRDGKAWFGKAPPDLSVIVRARNTVEHAGTDYIYTLLRGYYRDRASATGWNNVVYPNIAMPNIFWERQGQREATLTRTEYEAMPSSGTAPAQRRLVQTTSVFDPQGVVHGTRRELDSGAPSFAYSFRALDATGAAAVDDQVADLVAYLNWMSEPTANLRRRIGVWAIAYLVLFIGVGRWLNRIFWRDIH